MTTTAIRQKLHNFLEVADAKKVKAIYTLFEDEIVQEEMEYTDDFKAELDRRYEHYKNGGNMISASNAHKQIKKILQTSKQK